jgi:hypothetical protein
MKTIPTLLAALAASLSLSLGAYAADAPAAGMTKQEAKDAKVKSEAKYDAKAKNAEANEALQKGDCEVAHDGSAERACKKAAKQHAKAVKADAKAQMKSEEKAIDESKKK